MGPEVVVAVPGLGAGGVAALWRIANGLGKLEARITVVMAGLQHMLEDHEERLRSMERRPIDSGNP
jgi:hypothetical protein